MGLFGKLFGGKKAAPTKPEALGVSARAGMLYAPVAGRVEATADIPDPAFAAEVMGKTVAIWPTEGVVYAPVAGTATAAMPHAVGIMGDDGCEVLIHIGIDTVNMNGDGFTTWIEPGAHVEAGDPLVSVDLGKVQAAGHPDIVMTIVTNSDEYATLEVVASGTVAAGVEALHLAR